MQIHDEPRLSNSRNPFPDSKEYQSIGVNTPCSGICGYTRVLGGRAPMGSGTDGNTCTISAFCNKDVYVMLKKGWVDCGLTEIIS